MPDHAQPEIRHQITAAYRSSGHSRRKAAGDINLREHTAVAWLRRSQLFTLDWAEADLPVVDAYCRLFLKTEP